MFGPIHNVTYNTISGEPRAAKRVYTEWLVRAEDDEWRMYHCPDCRNPVAQYKGDLIAGVPGEAPNPYPIQIQCKNPKCGRKIVFKQAIEQVL